jgi:nitroimidazol reductase NimA-like FMN-containing flavoprotein (pyridoxamine 5'-phosphate oxidase superfamily)
VHGLYQELPDDEDWHTERLHAWSLLQQHTGWWEPGGLKPTTLPVASKSQHLFYSIDVTDMSGRRGIAGHPHDHPR